MQFRSSTSVANQTGGGGTNTVVLSVPAGVVNGDILIATIAVKGGSGTSITAPGGWNLILRTDNSTNISIASYWRVASSEPGSYTWNLGATVGNLGQMEAWMQGNTSSPINVSGGGNSGSSTAVQANSITTTTNGCQVLFRGTIDSKSTWTDPGGFANRNHVGGAADQPVMTCDDELQGTAGATGSATATAGATGQWVAHMIGLAPATSLAISSVHARRAHPAPLINIPRMHCHRMRFAGIQIGAPPSGARVIKKRRSKAIPVWRGRTHSIVRKPILNSGLTPHLIPTRKTKGKKFQPVPFKGKSNRPRYVKPVTQAVTGRLKKRSGAKRPQQLIRVQQMLRGLSRRHRVPNSEFKLPPPSFRILKQVKHLPPALRIRIARRSLKRSTVSTIVGTPLIKWRRKRIRTPIYRSKFLRQDVPRLNLTAYPVAPFMRDYHRKTRHQFPNARSRRTKPMRVDTQPLFRAGYFDTRVFRTKRPPLIFRRVRRVRIGTGLSSLQIAQHIRRAFIKPKAILKARAIRRRNAPSPLTALPIVRRIMPRRFSRFPRDLLRGRIRRSRWAFLPEAGYAIAGPYWIAAGQIFTPGAVQGDILGQGDIIGPP